MTDWEKMKKEFELREKYRKVLNNHEICDRCGTKMVGERCDYICPKCGARRTCEE